MPINLHLYKSSKPVRLTENETWTILYICQQKTNEEIGKLLNLSKRTIENLRVVLYGKLRVDNLAGLVICAIVNKYVIAPESFIRRDVIPYPIKDK